MFKSFNYQKIFVGGGIPNSSHVAFLAFAR